MTLLEELKGLQKEINEIFESEYSWEINYDLMFSKQLSSKVQDLISLDYCDPDTSYQEDVTAFVQAFNDKLSHLVTGNND